MAIPVVVWALMGAAALLAVKSDGGAAPAPKNDPPDNDEGGTPSDPPNGDADETDDSAVAPERSQRFESFLDAYARTPFHNAIAAAEKQNGIPTNLYARQLFAESSFRADAVSSAGALGIAQIMPETAKDLRVDPLNPAQAIPAGARYLSWLYRETNDWRAALIAYNWGIGHVQNYGVDQSPAESQQYADEILADSEIYA